MIVITVPGVSRDQIEDILRKMRIGPTGLVLSEENGRTLISIPQPVSEEAVLALEAYPWVEKVLVTETPYQLVAKAGRSETTRISVGNITIGGEEIAVIAGPCAVESYQQLHETAQKVKMAGAGILRGGAYKPRTSPYAFQGLEEEGLKMLQMVGKELNMPVVSEVMDPRLVCTLQERVDMIQIGARSMNNIPLLKEVGRQDKPVLLKRSANATYDEWLQSAEYIAAGGNSRIVLCERGIRTFETYTRNTLDLAAVPAIKHLSHLPILVDPSHGTGRWQMVAPMALAAVAAGADGIMIEVHPHPENALSDGRQSLHPDRFAQLMADLTMLASALGRTMKQAGDDL